MDFHHPFLSQDAFSDKEVLPSAFGGADSFWTEQWTASGSTLLRSPGWWWDPSWCKNLQEK